VPALEYRKLDGLEDWSGEAFSITSAKHDSSSSSSNNRSDGSSPWAGAFVFIPWSSCTLVFTRSVFIVVGLGKTAGAFILGE
jgi:hypothetical protein